MVLHKQHLAVREDHSSETFYNSIASLISCLQILEFKYSFVLLCFSAHNNMRDSFLVGIFKLLTKLRCSRIYFTCLAGSEECVIELQHFRQCVLEVNE